MNLQEKLKETTKRKRALFAIACCKRIWHLIKRKDNRKAVEITELYIDGKVTLKEVKEARDKAWEVYYNSNFSYPAVYAAYSIYYAESAYWAANAVYTTKEEEYQEKLLKEIIISETEISENILYWNNRTILKLAEIIYETQDYSSLPILSDALQEAGCNDQDILNHCKENFHVKGCWLIDSILGKQ